MAIYYLTPQSWSEDGYSGIATVDDIKSVYDCFRSQPVNTWKSWQDARDDCTDLEATNYEDAQLEAWAIDPDNLSPIDRPESAIESI